MRSEVGQCVGLDGMLRWRLGGMAGQAPSRHKEPGQANEAG